MRGHRFSSPMFNIDILRERIFNFTHIVIFLTESADGALEALGNLLPRRAGSNSIVDQSEKEVTDLHSRISQGIREAKKNGTKIGIIKGTTLTTKKSIDCKTIIQKHSKDFGGSLEDPDVLKLCGCSRNSYYKYKREIKKSNSY